MARSKILAHPPCVQAKADLSFLETGELPAGGLSDDQFDALVDTVAGTSVKVDVVMKMMGLWHTRDTVVGNGLLRGVSGGERHRITTAEMLVGPRHILMMDEISTGALALPGSLPPAPALMKPPGWPPVCRGLWFRGKGSAFTGALVLPEDLHACAAPCSAPEYTVMPGRHANCHARPIPATHFETTGVLGDARVQVADPTRQTMAGLPAREPGHKVRSAV